MLCLEEFHLFTDDVAQQEISQAAGADAEERVVEPLLAQHLLHDGVVYEGLTYAVDATSGLEAHLATRLLMICLDGLAHHIGRFGSGGRLLLACRGLDEVGTAIHGED